MFINDDIVEYWLSLKKPIFAYDGQIKFIITFSFNITARKKLESQLGLNVIDNDLGRPITAIMYQPEYYQYLDQGLLHISKNNYFLKKKLSIFDFFSRYNSQDVIQSRSMYELYKIIIHEFPGNVFWKDSQLKIKLISKAQADDLGLDSVKDAISKTNFDFCHYKSARALTNLDLDIINNRKAVVVEESSIMMKNLMEEKFYITQKKCIFNPFEKEYELIGTALDFTLRKQVEIKFRKALNKQYLEQEARDSFLANISHDIRTPITGMLGLIDDIKVNSMDLPNVQKNIDDLKSITNEFLDLFNGILNTVEDNESDLCTSNKVIFNLYNEINKALLLFSPIVNHDDVKLKCSIDDQSTMYYANISILKRILINLIGNAVKFTQCGLIQVIADYKDGFLNLSVKDSGIGISEKNIDTIFDKYVQDDLSPNHANNGHGLGLYMVKKYIKQLEGTIKVSSKQGVGTSFNIRIPIIVSKMSTKNKLVQEEKNKPNKRQIKDVLNKVLIVEDNLLAGMALRNMLQGFNFEVKLAETGIDGLKCAKKESFKYIFLDLGLPDQSGIDVLSTMREHSLTKKTPIFIVSGHISKDVHKTCIEAGATNTYTKPMSIEALKSLIDHS